jgi:hypothetical protein
VGKARFNKRELQYEISFSFSGFSVPDLSCLRN